MSTSTENSLDVITLTRNLVQIPSESSNPLETDPRNPEKAILELLLTLCSQAGIAAETLTVKDGRQNFIARWPRSGAKKLLISAHMDTVSAKGMTDPFSGRVADDKIWGRGACDDKGPLAACLSTLLAMRQTGKQPVYDLTFAATVDEECTMDGAVALAARLPEWDLCIGLEPTGLRIVKAHKGVYRFQVTTGGKAAHSSTPEAGENAIMAMLPIITDILAYADRLSQQNDPELGRASVAITQLNGGSSINIIPDSCSMGVDIRLLPGMAPGRIKEEITGLIGGRGDLREIFQGHPLPAAPANDLIAGFQKILSSQQLNPEAITVAYATDCSKMVHKGPCIIWGPGESGLAHQREEYIAIDQLKTAGVILENFLTTENA